MRSEGAREQQLPANVWADESTQQIAAARGISPGQLRELRDQVLASVRQSSGPAPTQVFAANSASAPFYVRRIANHLVARAAEPITLSELSNLSGMSARAIQARFRAHYGCTPMAFLRVRRLELARQMLDAQENPVMEVALSCGFSHVGRFSAAYRKQFGESPSQTRSRRARQA
jgi:transcriptional regulator GlxA family with amidase domain